MLISGIDVSAVTELSETMHSHSYGELLYMLEGEANILISGERRQLRGSDVLWIDSSMPHSVELAAETKPLLCRAQISTDVLSLGPRLPRIWCDSQADPDAHAFDALRETLTSILYFERQESAYFESVSLRYHLLDLLLRHYCVPQESVAPQHSAIQLVTQYVERNFDEPISLQTTADALHYSESYLSRLMRKKLSTTFSEYLQDVRLRHAAELLSQTEKQITAVAFECGFSSTSALSRLFPKKYGMSPSAWRAQEKQNREKTPSESGDRLLEYFGILEPKQEKQIDSITVVKANFHKLIGHTEQIWSSTVNIGPISDFFASHSKNGVMDALTELEARRVRFWSVFDRRILTVRGGSRKSFRFSQEFGEFLYSLNKSGIAPFFRIESWRVLNAAAEERCVMQSREDYLTAIRSLLLFLSSFNYHHSTVRYWTFELWEPDSAFLDDEYFETYDFLRAAVEELLPGAKTGGSGSRFGSRNGQQRLLVGRWSSRADQTDFLSFSFYPYSVDSEHQQHYISDPAIFPKELKLLRRELADSPLENLPVYITEWDAFCTENNYFNDSVWRGCYFAKTFADTIGKLDMLVCRQLVDAPGPFRSAAPLRGAPGLITDMLIRKPVYQVLRSFRTMESGLLCVEPGCIISGNGSQRAGIILYNYRHFNALFYSKNEADFEPEYLPRYLKKPANREFHIELEDVDIGSYRVEVYRCNKEHASPLDLWIRKGCFDYVGKYRLLHLMLDQNVDVLVYTVNCEDHLLRFDIQVEPLEFVSINVMKSLQ